MNKKILAILGILIISASIATVSAFSLDDLIGGSNPENITIDGIEFQIPDGFSEDTKYESVNETASQGGVEYTYNQKLFEKDNESVSILVGDYGKYKVTDDIIKAIADDEKTINGIKGFTSNEDGIDLFAYAKNDKLVVITSTDGNLIGDFLIAE